MVGEDQIYASELILLHLLMGLSLGKKALDLITRIPWELLTERIAVFIGKESLKISATTLGKTGSSGRRRL